ncbi:GNAT family N-acetyltransferase [Pseudalkalibacillus sp. A8]|uniref:GNAT family N-acetyltransferase n=1 Tax=Pseudalkalibacillus sp. A8 TaxID=3382641 RepID=UPI0038B46A2E
MYKIRGEVVEDIQKIKEVNDQAFGQENETRLIEAIRKSDSFIPELSLVAKTGDGDVIGHILFSLISIETKDGEESVLALAPMAVKPDCQNKGVGSALVRVGLERCEAAGYRSVVVLGHPEFYPRFGFVRASTKGIRPPFEVPDAAFMVNELVPGSLEGTKGTVQYPEAFSAASDDSAAFFRFMIRKDKKENVNLTLMKHGAKNSSSTYLPKNNKSIISLRTIIVCLTTTSPQSIYIQNHSMKKR